MTASSTPARLLAKSIKKGQCETPGHSVAGHCLDVEQAARLIFKKDSRTLERWCTFFKLEGEGVQERFLLHLRIAALMHDLGKANEEFQKAVSGNGFHAQSVRHEHISALLLLDSRISKWLFTNQQLDRDILLATILSHHLKASPRGDGDKEGHKWGAAKAAQTFQVYLGHPEVAQVLREVARIARLGPPPLLCDELWDEKAGPTHRFWQDHLQTGFKLAKRFGFNLTRKDKDKQLLCALKAGLIVSDAVGSALARTGQTVETWVEAVLHKPALSPADLEAHILQPYRESTEGFAERDFQTRAAQVGPRALLLAACGTGKTYAAWSWAREQLRTHKLGHAVFLYPTRATATEGFVDYVSFSPGDAGALMHSASRYEMERMLQNPSDDAPKEDFRRSEAEERLYNLGWWSRRYISATADQFLSFMQFQYGALCMLPVFTDAAVIIDEVHSYDSNMFRDLVHFLQHFQGPVLCMTATLPSARKRQLQELGLQVFPGEGEALEQLRQQEEHPRYDIHTVEGKDAMSLAQKAYQQGMRVLWVVNTVRRAQELAQELTTSLGHKVLCYHSRFRLQDRQRVHAQTIKAFAKTGHGEKIHACIAVTTQVCEMSLDLDADVLLTEAAPATALVQRFGRSNRHRRRGDSFRAQIYVYDPPSMPPYRKEEMKASRDMLAALAQQETWSQADLASALEAHGAQEPEPSSWSRLLDSGYYAEPGRFRDIKPYQGQAVLDTDVDTVASLYEAQQPIDAYILSAPVRVISPVEREKWPAWLGQVDAANYSEDQGLYPPPQGA